MTADHRIPFALGPDGEVASIHDVPRGLPCRCTCPSCGARLVAKKGPIQAKHFAHERGADCASGLESSIHLAVKTILSRERQMQVPSCTVVRSADGERPPVHRSDIPTVKPYYYPEKLDHAWAARVWPGVAGTSAKRMVFDDVLVERKEGDIRPDLIGLLGDRKLYIEVAVTSPVTLDKLEQIRARRTATIEIRVPYDRNKELSWELLREMVVEQTKGKVWLYHPNVESRADEHFERMAPEREAAEREAAVARERAEEQQRKYLELERIRAARQAAKQAARLAARQVEEARRLEAARIEREERLAKIAEIRENVIRQMDELKAKAARTRSLSGNTDDTTVAEVRYQQRHEVLGIQDRLALPEIQATEPVDSAALLARLRDGTPSPHHPLDSRVLFLDVDGVLQPGSPHFHRSLDELRRALHEMACSIVITSASRDTCNMEELSQMLAPLGGRHLSATPALDIKDSYSRRTREIATWLGTHPEVKIFVLNSASCGSWPGWTVHIVPPNRGLVEGDITVVRRWLRAG